MSSFEILGIVIGIYLGYKLKKYFENKWKERKLAKKLKNNQ